MTDVVVSELRHAYRGNPVLRDVSAVAPGGRTTVVTGPSGSGKTTLLHAMSALIRPDHGSVRVGGVDLARASHRARTRWRASVGLVFQRSGLISGLTVRENVCAGHVLTGRIVDQGFADELMERLEIAHLASSPAVLLSGGQAQRVAVVRALAHRPQHVFADEPTASLDVASTRSVHEVLRDVSEADGTTVVMASHESVAEEYAHEVWRLVDGVLEVDPA